MTASAVGSLSAELEASLARALLGEWTRLNRDLFGGALESPVIELSDAESRLGCWRRGARTMEIARGLALRHTWGEVVEVLKHEMAHQYVDEVMCVRNETAHGPAFRQLCERLTIDPAGAGLPAAGQVGTKPGGSRALARVTKLLALAESPNVHEAQAAMAEAQRLMLVHNLEAVSDRRYGFRQLGQPTGRRWQSDLLLASILTSYFFVEAIWVSVWRPREGKRGRVLEVSGTPENLDMASYVHAFLSHTAQRLWSEYRRERGLRSTAERRTYIAGVMRGFADKLQGQRERHQEQGLVWAGDADLKDYHRRRHPRVRTTRRAGGRWSEAHADGREAGRRIVIHRGVRAAASAHGRLLPEG